MNNNGSKENKNTFMSSDIISLKLFSQSFQEQYESFKNETHQNYASFRDECNKKYVQFLIDAWGLYYGEEQTPIPDDNPVPPKPYEMGENRF